MQQWTHQVRNVSHSSAAKWMMASSTSTLLNALLQDDPGQNPQITNKVQAKFIQLSALFNLFITTNIEHDWWKKCNHKDHWINLQTRNKSCNISEPIKTIIITSQSQNQGMIITIRQATNLLPKTKCCRTMLWCTNIHMEGFLVALHS